jgi:hypothetical protein
MIASFRLAVLGLLAAAFAAASPGFAQGEVANPPDPYLHRAVGIAFPAEADGFDRIRVYEFDAQGSDAAIVYGPSGQAGDMSLYVYPASGVSCKDHFDLASDAILERNGQLLFGDSVFSIPEFGTAKQLSAEYRIPPNGFGSQHPELVSYLWVGCPSGSNWMVKYRGSFPATDEVKAIGRARKIFAAIDWTPLTGNSD